MRKRCFSILTLLVAMFAISSSQSVVAADTDPTLTQVWKVTNSLPPAGMYKDGAGVDGKFYLKSIGSSIDIWGEDGNTGEKISVGTGGGIATDEAGNIVVRDEYFAGANPRFFQIIPKGSTVAQDLELTLSVAGRVDHLACASGDILSAEGGKLYLFCTGQTSVNVVTIKNGVQTECVTVATSASTGDATSEAYPVIGDTSAFLTHVRGEKAIYKNDGAGNDAKLTTPDINSTAGSCMFQLQGANYIVYNTGDNYADGFSIANMATGEKVATHANETNPGYSGNGTTANHLSYEAKDDYSVYIYAYTPGAMIAKYEFDVAGREIVPTPDPETDPETKNAVYLLGEVSGQGWAPNAGTALETTDGVTYYGTVTFAGSDANYSYFSITTQLAESADDWDAIKASRYGAAADGQILANDTQTAIAAGENAFKVQSAEYIVTVNMTDMSIKVVATGELPVIPGVTPEPETDPETEPAGDAIYLIGEVDGNGWAANVGAELVKDGDVYKGAYNITGYFGITTKLGATADDEGWATCNANRYGASAADEVISSGSPVAITKGENSFKIGSSGVYNVTVDLNANTITLEPVELLYLDITPASGTYTPGEKVTIACVNAPAAEIYYTLDGSKPDKTSTKYSEPFELAEGQYVLKAIAYFGEGYSLVTTASYNVTDGPSGPITVKFLKPADWDTVTLWAWTGGGENLFAAWPGETMTDDGDGWWSYTCDESVTELNVIFNNAGTVQTGDTKGIVSSTNFKFAGAGVAAEMVVSSVADAAADMKVAVYPNPATDLICVEAADGVSSVEVLDITGKVVAKSAAAQVDVASLPAGLYLVKINNAKIVKVIKK